MNDEKALKLAKVKIPYRVVRVMVLLFIVMMFFPQLNPAGFISKCGQATVGRTASFFTSAISYSSLVNGLSRGFKKGWIDESGFYLLFAMCLTTLVGVVLSGIGSCMSVGNNRMKTVANRFLLGGTFLMAGGVVGVLASYYVITGSANVNKITYSMPTGLYLFLVVAILAFISALVVFIMTPRADKSEKMWMESQYRLFLMLMPFLALVFAFSYLPLYSWRYAFFDYTAGSTLSMDNFVGFKWFKVIVQNQTYFMRIVRVLKNTLAMSGLGIATSWLPMAFAIFLTEIKSIKYRRFVQTFTTLPNFISWVLIYAIALAIFSTDGFINTFINNFVYGGVETATTNYLMSTNHMWLKMLAWGTWKGVGWSAIIYISGISGIDQQLYEAADIDGANRFDKMRHVTLPGLLPTYVVMLVMSIAGVLSNGMDQYLVFSNSLNQDYIEVLDLYVYNLGIGSGSIPLSTVVGMTKSIVSVVLLFVANNISKAIRGAGVV